MTAVGNCRHCAAQLEHSFCDLGMSPLSNAYLSASDLQRPKKLYPLHAYVCESCFLVQLQAFESPEQIFGDYAYFSSYFRTWLEHAREYSERMVIHWPLLHLAVSARDAGYGDVAF